MSAAPDIITQVHVAGGRIMMIQDRLRVRAPSPLPDELVANLRQHKAEIMALLLDRKAAWTPEDWRAFFDERAAIAEHDGELPRAKSEARAYECCVVEWMRQHPPLPSNPELCAHCGEAMAVTAALPVLNGAGGHVWMHDHCHALWMRERRTESQNALRKMGIGSPSK